MFEPLPAAFPDGDGDQSPLVFQRQEHRFGQWPLASYDPAGHARYVAVAAPSTVSLFSASCPSNVRPNRVPSRRPPSPVTAFLPDTACLCPQRSRAAPNGSHQDGAAPNGRCPASRYPGPVCGSTILQRAAPIRHHHQTYFTLGSRSGMAFPLRKGGRLGGAPKFTGIELTACR